MTALAVRRRCADPDCRVVVADDGLEVCTAHIPLQLGISYRQLDYWVRRDFLRPEDASPGSGYARRWPAAELDVARRMGVLTKAGLPLPWAARFARHDWPRGELVPGVVVEVTV